ncbi:MAG TPA: TadG family pilus assembly protein [Tepidisphaeraceae bacterium]|jgi:Flp pilus assembly protein TadG|nr:TadG family pilus assembly protein [Tepidisphaeraceae bacterium]
MSNTGLDSPRPRRGVALVYVAIVGVVMMGFCSLAVDLGRYEMVQSQLYNAAMAAARAGANNIAKSNDTATSTTTAATNMATSNMVDGVAIPSSAVTVQFIKWTSATNYVVESTSNYAQANAVGVTITYNVPLLFARVLGLASKSITKMSIAEVVTTTATPYVYATGNPWLAGEPLNTTGSVSDSSYTNLHGTEDHQYPHDIAGGQSNLGKNTHGSTATSTNYSSYEPYASPVQVAITVTPGSRITVTNVSGNSTTDHDTTPNVTADGNGGTTGVYSNDAAKGIGEHGMADVAMPVASMVGVFLGSGLPDNIATVPPKLDFSTQAARDYVGLQPMLQQPFYVGTGLTSGGKQQSVLVPPDSTRLFLGIMDGHEWDNNNGGFNATITQTTIVTVQ